jgi:hypothetical protein
MCALMLHNFIRIHQLYEDEYDAPGAVVEGGGDDNNVLAPEVQGNNNELKQWRLDIADAMWADYQQYINQPGYDDEEDDDL